MVKQNLKINLNSNEKVGVIAPTVCTCTKCALCLACAIFAPIVGVFLAPTIAVYLNEAKSQA